MHRRPFPPPPPAALETASFVSINRACHFLEFGNTATTDFMMALAELAISFIANKTCHTGAASVCHRLVKLLGSVDWAEAVDLPAFPGFINALHGASVRLRDEDPQMARWRSVQPELWMMHMARTFATGISDIAQATAVVDCLALYLTPEESAELLASLESRVRDMYSIVTSAVVKYANDEAVDALTRDSIIALAVNKKDDAVFLSALSAALKDSLKDDVQERVAEAFVALLGKWSEKDMLKVLHALWQLVFADRSLYEVGAAHRVAMKRAVKGLAAEAVAEFNQFAVFASVTTRAGL